MLVLTRKPGEKVVIDGGITVSVLEVDGNRVRIGIDAPRSVTILRGELTFWAEADQEGLKGSPRKAASAALLSS